MSQGHNDMLTAVGFEPVLPCSKHQRTSPLRHSLPHDTIRFSYTINLCEDANMGHNKSPLCGYFEYYTLYFGLICTGLVARKSIQPFSEFATESLERPTPSPHP